MLEILIEQEETAHFMLHLVHGDLRMGQVEAGESSKPV